MPNPSSEIKSYDLQLNITWFSADLLFYLSEYSGDGVLDIFFIFVLCCFLNSISEGSYFIYPLKLLHHFLARFSFLAFLSIRKRGLTLHLYYKVLTGGAEIKVHVGFVAIHTEK